MATARYYPSAFHPHGSPIWEGRKVIYLALAVAVLSACAMFFALWERDDSFLHQASQSSQPVYVRQPVAKVQPSTPPQLPAAAAKTQQPKVETAAEYIPFVLTRSKHLQRLGPLTIGLWRTDAKRGTYDASVVVDGHRFDKKHVGMDQALAIRVGNAAPMELIVNRVTRNDISGYLSKPR